MMVMLNEPFPQKFPKSLFGITNCPARKETPCLVEFGTSKPDARVRLGSGVTATRCVRTRTSDLRLLQQALTRDVF